jgi:hypothetical protein
MGWFEDACAWVDQAVEDVGAAIDDAADAVVDAASDVVDWVGDAVEDVGEAIVQTVVGAGETLVDFGEAVGATLSGADLEDTWTDFGLNALDNMVFDPVDYLTGGDVNLDYEDGSFTADVDLNLGIGAVGLHVGDAGFDASASFDIGIASGSVSLDSSAGFAASGSLGIADGPWPYAEGHLSIDGNGDVLIGGEIQGSLPIPGGAVSFGLDGEAEFNSDGSFGMQGSFDTEVDGPMGMGGSFHTDGHLEADPFDGTAGIGGNIDAEATGPGGSHVDAHAGFDAGLDDGQFESTVEAGLDAGLAGKEFDAGFQATVGAGVDGASLAVDRWADLDLPDPATGAGAGENDGSSVGANQQALSGDDGGGLGGDGAPPAFEDPFAADAGVDTSAFQPPAEVAVVEAPAFDAPPDEFSQQIDAAEQIDDAADDMWDGLGQ